MVIDVFLNDYTAGAVELCCLLGCCATVAVVFVICTTISTMHAADLKSKQPPAPPK